MNELINVTIENNNGVLVTTSNRVAEELGVRHDHLLEKIDDYITQFQGSPESLGTPQEFYILSQYQHPQNKQWYRNYLITEKGVAQLIGGYSAAVPKAFALNVAYINAFEKMKQTLQQQAQAQYYIPQNYSEALKLAYEQSLQIEEQKQQISTMQPKVDFANHMQKEAECVSIHDLANILDYQGLGSGNLFKWLYANNIIYKDTNNVIQPYRGLVDKGILKVRINESIDKFGERRYYQQIVVTPLGIDKIRKVLDNQGYIRNGGYY